MTAEAKDGTSTKENPRPVQLTRAGELKTAHGQTDGMVRQVQSQIYR